MADNVLITPGTGESIAAEEISVVKYQKVKLVAGKAGSIVPIGHLEDDAHVSGDGGVMGLLVRKDAAAALGADGDYVPGIVDAEGAQYVRPVPKQVCISVTPTISTSIYASGDVLGTGNVPMEFTNAVRKSGGSGIVQSIIVLDKTQAQRAAIDLMFFDRLVTVANDNAAVAMSDADMANCLGVITIGAYNTAWPGTPLNSISTLINVGLPIICNGMSLWVVAVVRGTPTYVATTDLEFKISILQD